MKKTALSIILIFMSLFLSTNTVAHPGHGNKGIDGNSVVHFLTEPIHIFSVLVISVAIFVFVRKTRKARRQKNC